MSPRDIAIHAGKPNIISSITLGDQADLPENADELTNSEFYASQISQILKHFQVGLSAYQW